MTPNDSDDGSERAQDRPTVMADIDVSEATWERIAETARSQHESGRHPEGAYYNAIFDELSLKPRLYVNGEITGPEDIDGLPADEEDQDDA